MGNDAVKAQGAHVVEDSPVLGIQGGFGLAHTASGRKAVPDGLGQGGTQVHCRKEACIGIVAPCGAVAQNAETALGVYVHPGAKAAVGTIKLVLQDLAVFLHAAQGSVDAQDTIHGVLDGNGLSRWRGRRKGGVGKALRSSHEGHGQRDKKGRDHKQSEFSHGLLSKKGLSDFVLGRL